MSVKIIPDLTILEQGVPSPPSAPVAEAGVGPAIDVWPDTGAGGSGGGGSGSTLTPATGEVGASGPSTANFIAPGNVGDILSTEGTPLTATWSHAVGPGSVATGVQSYAIGNACIASGDHSIAIGNLCQATQGLAVAIGSMNIASGAAAVALGEECTATEPNAVAIGFNNNATAFAACALGVNLQASGEFSTALGVNTAAKRAGQYSHSSGPLGTLASGGNAIDLGATLTHVPGSLLQVDSNSFDVENNSVMSLHIRVVAATGGPTKVASEEWDVLISQTNVGGPTILAQTQIWAPAGHTFVSQGWTLTFSTPGGSEFRVTVDPGADTVNAYARLEWVELDGLV